MRPVRLDMHGFAAFRELATVDFTGADYFALVGPTGAGKSTVIDAMCFALYGTVPRWDDRRAVHPALAPSVNRGVVRLVFDLGATRYVAVRELRRSARGTVTVRSARLERLADPADLDGDTTVLAADSATTGAVEQLLGLPFDQFCQCVVLPQGEFAEFLHAKPRDRQQMLTRLLGLGVYETIAREANREAAAAGERADVLAGQLDAYTDATDDAVDEARRQAAALTGLAARTAAACPALVAADAAVAAAVDAVAAVDAERSRLAALSVPTGTADLDDRRRADRERCSAAADRVSAAESVDAQARAARAAAPDRGPLERARRDHADLVAALAARPDAEAAHAAARAADESAGAAAAAAAVALETARAERDCTGAAHTAAREVVARLAAERDVLTAVEMPAGLDRLGAQGRTAADDLAAAQKALDEAESADAAAREARAAAPARRPLERVLAEHESLLDAEAARPRAVQAHSHAVAAAQRADAAVDTARADLAHARVARDAAARADLAMALRPELAVGQPCPVCEQVVHELPAAAGAPPAGDAAVAEADAALDRARRSAVAATAAAERAGAEVQRLDAEIARLRSALATAPVSSAAAAREAIDALDAADADAARLDADVRRARAERDRAARAVDEVRAELRRAGELLRAARDPLVGLGAPGLPDGDVASGWAALVSWAARQADERATALPAARADADAAARAASGAAAAFVAAEQALAARRTDERAAARAEQAAGSALSALDARIADLRAALDGAPADAEAAVALARIDELDAAAAAAAAELRAAHADRGAADAALAAVERELAAGWEALRAARDPLVMLGAPAVGGDDLTAGWRTLAAWAAAGVADRDDKLPQLRADADTARAARDHAARTLAADLGRHGLGPWAGRLPAADPGAGGVEPAGHLSAGDPGAGRVEPVAGRQLDDATRTRLVEVAPALVAEALAGARAAHDRLVERCAEAARLRADRAQAEEAQQVARMLGNLLRSDNFPRWLVASALDVLVADASASLAELSGGQFELTHDDGEFVVVDHADADARRPVKTLSGGETFQASLALALALSAQLSTLAADGAARLDSIFLDEGFGTLDEANLEVVASTLENLASRGDRMVGVITHVPALAERVPVRFAVRRDQRGSSVVREGP